MRWLDEEVLPKSKPPLFAEILINILCGFAASIMFILFVLLPIAWIIDFVHEHDILDYLLIAAAFFVFWVLGHAIRKAME